MNRYFINIFLILGSFIPSGCHYKGGYPINQTNIKTISVLPAKIEAIVPQASTPLTRQIRNNLLQNSIKLASNETADAILETSIINYGRSIGSVEEYDTDVAKTLSLNATIRCSLKHRISGKYYFKDQTFSASININANNLAQTIEYQRLPQLTEKLAKKVSNFILNTDSTPIIK